MPYRPVFQTRLVCASSLTLLTIPMAAGDDVTTPPTPTPRYPAGQIHEQKAGKCVPAKSSSLTDNAPDQAVRVLDTMTDSSDDRVLTDSGLVEAGDLAAARRQHDEILARGGKGTWAEESLRTALSSGRTYRY
jgi:hypothetical protein